MSLFITAACESLPNCQFLFKSTPITPSINLKPVTASTTPAGISGDDTLTYIQRGGGGYLMGLSRVINSIYLAWLFIQTQEDLRPFPSLLHSLMNSCVPSHLPYCNASCRIRKTFLLSFLFSAFVAIIISNNICFSSHLQKDLLDAM